MNSAPIPPLPKTVQHADFVRLAAAKKVELAVVLTCDEIETGGISGMLPSGLSKGLHEARHFHQRTGGRFDRAWPNLSSPIWDRTLYRGGQAERERLEQARELDLKAANESFSWGRFQIMGFNHVAAGWPDVGEFAFDMDTSEVHHLEAWGGLVETWKLLPALRSGYFEPYWKGWNGPAYASHGYGTKFLSILARRRGQADDTLIGRMDMLRIGMRGPRVVDLQKRLAARGLYLGAADGLFGKGTERAVEAFQALKALAQDGVAGPATLSRL